ncbi:MAG TPA: LCP family protein [Candidatus Saccharimonadales bacterium]|nr:LCP family protein [Candidatus Saccharimonadales bacterium]
MTQQRNSMDGFVPRRSNTPKVDEPMAQAANRFNQTRPVINNPETSSRRRVGVVTPIAKRDLDESLKGIDEPEQGKKGKKRRGDKKPKSKLRRIIKWVLIVLAVAIIGIAGYFVYKSMNAGSQIFKGSILDIIQNKPLKQDENGRSNILVLGTSQDDPGHEAGYLTDSIMIISVDQKNKNAYMVSIPRDMEVQYGQGCMSGYSGKINAYYNCVGGGTDNIDSERAALAKEQAFIGGITGLDIQYGVNVNYTVMRELVNAVGGITVTIESRDPRGQMDSNFDWKCGVGDRKVSRAEVLRRCPPSGHFIDYPNGPVTLDAEHALYLAQARGDRAPTYGFEQSNFDREKNQQKIVKAIREKALSAGVLTDFGKVSGIIDALGNNLRTTFESSEVRTLVSLAKDIKDSDIQSIVLNDPANPILNGNAQPVAGKFQFGPLKEFLKKKLSSNPVVSEEANVVVLNGSGVAGVAQKEADKLEAQGFTISNVSTAPEATYADVEVYQIGDGMPATKGKLELLFGIKVKTTAPPVTPAAGTNFVVIFGKDRSASE